MSLSTSHCDYHPKGSEAIVLRRFVKNEVKFRVLVEIPGRALSHSFSFGDQFHCSLYAEKTGFGPEAAANVI